MRKEPEQHRNTGVGLRRASNILFFTILLVGPTAMGQSADDAAGWLNSYACEEITKPFKIDVQLTDNAPDLLKLKDKFTAQLKRDGIGVSAGAQLLLMLDIRTVRNIEQSEKGHIGELQIGKGGGVSLRGKVWSNTGDSVLGGRKKTGRQRTVDQLSLTAVLIGAAMVAVYGKVKSYMTLGAATPNRRRPQ